MTKLLNDEKKLFTSGDQLMLTNYRIVKTDEVMGENYRIDIFLENISSIESLYKSYLILLVLAVILLIGGSYFGSTIGGFVLGIVFALLWWFTRKRLIIVKPNGGKPLKIFIKHMSKEEVNDIIFNIEEAKLNRVNRLCSKCT